MFKSSKKYLPTYILIVVNIAVYAWTAFLSRDFINIGNDVVAQYGQYNDLVLNHGAYWQLFTAMFVHVSIVHIAGNMIFLLIFGLRAEEMFDIKEYLLIYLLSGFAGNFLTLLFGPDMISAGASGAIFGVFGAVTIYVRRAVGQSITTALMYAFFLLLLSFSAGVNVLAHLGGLVVGLLIGYVVAATRKRTVTYQYRYTYAT
jgi:rhomboid protease GluP